MYTSVRISAPLCDLRNLLRKIVEAAQPGPHSHNQPHSREQRSAHGYVLTIVQRCGCTYMYLSTAISHSKMP